MVLFEMETDPGERSPLGESESVAAERLLHDLREELSGRRPSPAEAATLDEGDVERLRALGYVN